MGGKTYTPAVLRQYQGLFDKLYGDDSASVAANPVGLFDSYLKELSKITSAMDAQAASAKQTSAAPDDEAVRTQILSEIERQLFLHFLISEITYLRTHLIMRAGDLHRKLNQDHYHCKRLQQQLSGSLIRIFKIQGIDKAFYDEMAAERGETVAAYIKMRFTPKEFTMMSGLDDLLNNRETAAVRRMLEEMLDYYSDVDAANFTAEYAWIDLKEHWDKWASTHGKRIAAFKELWQITGGGKDLNSDLKAFKVIDDYYKELYEQIENGTTDDFWAAVIKSTAAD